MARLPRLAVAGHAHLVIQRGHNGQPVFVDNDDRESLLGLLRGTAAAEGVAVHGYALLDNEIRLLVTPASAEGLSRLMQALGRRHGARFNRRHMRVGTLWSGRFRATVVDPDGWVLKSLRYVEGAGLPPSSWSSAPHHLGQRRDPLVCEHPAYWSLGNTPFEREAGWRRLIDEALTAAENDAISKAVLAGWPLGGERFKAGLAKAVSRRLAPARRGRPKGSRRIQSAPK